MEKTSRPNLVFLARKFYQLCSSLRRQIQSEYKTNCTTLNVSGKLKSSSISKSVSHVLTCVIKNYLIARHFYNKLFNLTILNPAPRLITKFTVRNCTTFISDTSTTDNNYRGKPESVHYSLKITAQLKNYCYYFTYI